MKDPADIKLPVEGNPKSLVRVTAFEDLECPDSRVWRMMLDEVLLPRYAETVAFAAFDFPLDRHVWAKPAAIVSRRMSLISPERCLDFRRYCYEHISEITAENFPERIVAYAERVGLDSEDISISVRNPDFTQAVELDIAEGHRLSLTRTPTVIVGDHTFADKFGVDGVIAAIEETLQR